MNFVVRHIYCENNTCINRLTSHGISLQKYFVSSFVTRFCMEKLQSLSYYRFGQSLFYFVWIRLLMFPPTFILLLFIYLMNQIYNDINLLEIIRVLSKHKVCFIKKKNPAPCQYFNLHTDQTHSTSIYASGKKKITVNASYCTNTRIIRIRKISKNTPLIINLELLYFIPSQI